MGVIEGVLKEEYNRLLEMEKFYSSEINKFPKGSVLKRKIGGGIYYYIKLRDHGMVKSVYISEDKAKEMIPQIKERRRLNEILKSVRNDIRVLKKVIK